MQPILVLTASQEPISIKLMIKWRSKYVHLRQVPNAYLLAIFDTWPDPPGRKILWPESRPDPWMKLTRVHIANLSTLLTRYDRSTPYTRFYDFART